MTCNKVQHNRTVKICVCTDLQGNNNQLRRIILFGNVPGVMFNSEEFGV